MLRVLSALVFALALSSVPAFSQQDRTVSVPNADNEMRAAIDKAKANLPQFWEALAHPRPGEARFALKVKVEDNGRIEHFWVNEILRRSDRITGTITNAPEIVSTVKLGQRYEFKADQISDWMYRRHGKIVGNETMRALLKYLPPPQAAEYRAMLETP